MTHSWRWLCIVLVLAGCDPAGRPAPADRPVPATQVKDFDTLYAQRCSGCHGADGTLGPAPPLNDPLFLAIVPEAELVRVISGGRLAGPAQKTPMPAFAHDKGGPLTGAQVKVLAQGLKKRWRPSTRAALPSYLASSGTGNHKEGQRVFANACAGCHGANGRGGKDGRHAINNTAFLALVSDQALRRLVITGRPDLGMPAYDEPSDGRPSDFSPLTAPEIDDLVALLVHWRQANE